MSFVIALFVGVLCGYFGAILPGPVNFSVIRKAMNNQVRAALLIATGGATMDALFCVAIGLGVGWFSAFVSQPMVRLLLALFLGGYGAKIAIYDREKGSAPVSTTLAADRDSSPSHGSVFVGALQGAANPALIVSWTIIIGFLVGHGIIRADAYGTLGFSTGVAIGGFGWFCSLIGIFRHYASSPMIRWWKRSTVFGGGALVVLGAWYAFRTLRDL